MPSAQGRAAALAQVSGTGLLGPRGRDAEALVAALPTAIDALLTPCEPGERVQREGAQQPRAAPEEPPPKPYVAPVAPWARKPAAAAPAYPSPRGSAQVQGILRRQRLRARGRRRRATAPPQSPSAEAAAARSRDLRRRSAARLSRGGCSAWQS